MTESRIYHEGSRELQDRFDTRRIADRLERVDLHAVFTDAERELIETAPMFFLATLDADGFPDVSYKGGVPGFVQVVGESTLAFPNYDGNGMYKSLGNALADSRVGVLFVRWAGKPKKLRVQGRAEIVFDDPLMDELPGAQFIVRVHAERIFDNCPRYIHRMVLDELSKYAPRPDHAPPIPDWKRNPVYRDALPERDLAALAGEEAHKPLQ
jgi:predicted pyridoxine 5'-phosphate oxidase superfamily flavin-nucleotide-binding protein